MSAGMGSVAAQAGWNVLIDPGDEVSIFGGTFYFDRVDPDGAVTFRPPVDSQRGDFMVQGADGRPRKPTQDEIAVIWREGNLIFVEKKLASAARQLARNQQLDVQQARAMDKRSAFRAAMVRRFHANPWSRSDQSLRAFIEEALQDPDIAKLPGARVICPASLRTWLRERGSRAGCKERDGISMTGRMPRKMRIGHPLEIVMYWALRAGWVRGDVQKNYDRYSADITKINQGQGLNRFLLIDPDGEYEACQRPAVYPIPKTRYESISYRRFCRLARALRSESAYAAKTTRQGAYQRYGGGGLSELPTHLGAFAWIDDTPIPKAFFIDGRTGIPIGQSTMTLVLEQKTRVVPGWDLSPGPPSSSTAINAILHANLPKDVPQELLDIDPNLTWTRFKPGTVGFDNSTGNHARSAEEFLAEAYIGTRFFGSGMSRDKSHMERVIGTFLDLVFKHQEGSNYDIERMRKYRFNENEFFDPSKHVLITIQTARRLLTTAVMVYNVTSHRALDGRPPALVWQQELKDRKLDKLLDEQALRDSKGDVEFDMVMTNAGIAKFNRRYTPAAPHGGSGALEMKRILQQFERSTTLPRGDIGHKQKHSRDDRKRLSFRVKGKYDREDLGVIRIWNPHNEPPQWEIFSCTDPNAHGTPLWMHQRCLEIAAAESLEYATPEQQAYVRAKLFEDIASVDGQSAERERRTLARAVDHPQVRAVLSRYVEVVDEDVEMPGNAQPERYPPVGHHSALGRRKDAAVPTPRLKEGAPKAKVKMQPAAYPPVTLAPPAAPSSSGRRHRRTDNQSANPRDMGMPTKSADRPDQRVRRARSTVKWGDKF